MNNRPDPPRAALARGRESKLDRRQPECSVEACETPATIYHRTRPYCGKHAAALLERGERPDRAEDLPKTGHQTQMIERTFDVKAEVHSHSEVTAEPTQQNIIKPSRPAAST